MCCQTVGTSIYEFMVWLGYRSMSNVGGGISLLYYLRRQDSVGVHSVCRCPLSVGVHSVVITWCQFLIIFFHSLMLHVRIERWKVYCTHLRSLAHLWRFTIIFSDCFILDRSTYISMSHWLLMFYLLQNYR